MILRHHFTVCSEQVYDKLELQSIRPSLYSCTQTVARYHRTLAAASECHHQVTVFEPGPAYYSLMSGPGVLD